MFHQMNRAEHLNDIFSDLYITVFGNERIIGDVSYLSQSKLINYVVVVLSKRNLKGVVFRSGLLLIAKYFFEF